MLDSTPQCYIAGWVCYIAPEGVKYYVIRNDTSIGGRAINTIQQQNDIGVVCAQKGEQN